MDSEAWRKFDWEFKTPEHHSYTANMKIMRKLFMVLEIEGVDSMRLADYMVKSEEDLIAMANGKRINLK